MLGVLVSVRPAIGAMESVPPERPLLPVAQKWSETLSGAIAQPAVTDGTRVFLAYAARQIAAVAVADGHELWRQSSNVSCPLAIDGALLFSCNAGTLEARRTADGTVAWAQPNVTTVAPLVAQDGWLLAVTDKELIAIRDTDGTILWRQAAGGVRLAPAIDGDEIYLGARDGRLAALKLATGAQIWQTFVQDGITALAGSHGRAYAGGGDKQFYCYNGASGEVISGWPWRVGALVVGHIAIDEDHVYFASLDNAVRALDRGDGDQRWDHLLRERPWQGVFAIGHLVFVPSSTPNLLMLYAKNGQPSGTLTLPDKVPMDLPPAVALMPGGLGILAVTTGLSNTWVLTMFGPETEPALEPLSTLPGLPYLTDPELQTPARGLWGLLAGDPLLRPLDEIGWPVLLLDPPLEPLTALPGLQLRSLSSTLPIRRAPPAPGG